MPKRSFGDCEAKKQEEKTETVSMEWHKNDFTDAVRDFSGCAAMMPKTINNIDSHRPQGTGKNPYPKVPLHRQNIAPACYPA